MKFEMIKNVLLYRKVFSKQNILSILMALYFCFASSYFIDINEFKYRVIMYVLGTVLLFPLFKYVLKRTKCFCIETNENNTPSKKEFFLYLIISAIFCSFYFIALYPGWQSQDTIDQWNQAISNTYSNWHPVIHTLLFYKVPSTIGNDYTFAVIWQLIMIVVVLAIICYGYRKVGFRKKEVLIMLILVLINPYNARMINVVWKDVAFSFLLLLSSLVLIYTVSSRGEWLSKKRNIVKFSVLLLLMLFMRHNGIISVIFILGGVFLAFYKYWKRIFVMAISVLSSYFIITNIVFNVYQVEKHTSTFSEAIGIPLNQISYIYNNNGNISQQNEEYLLNIADLDIWKLKYNKRNFNPIKWERNAVNIERINEQPSEFFQNYFVLVKNNIGLAVESFYNVTSTIWSIEDAGNEIGAKADDFRYNEKNEKIYKISDKLNYILNNYNRWINNIGIGKIVFGYGGSLFIILLSICIVINKNKVALKKYLPYIPVLSNTLGIVLLITGEEHRFVYAQVLCAIPLLFYALSNITTKKEENEEYTLLHKLFVEKTENTLLQFFRYIFVGGIAAVVNIGSLFILTDISKVYYIISNILAFILGLFVNYILSKIFVFSQEKVKSKTKELITYAVIGIIGLGIDTLFMFIFTSVFSIYYLVSKILSTAITFLWNFCARKLMYKREEKNYGSNK